MNIESVKMVRNWTDVLNRCRTTINKEYIDKEPSDEWKRKIILSEHSPLRLLEFDISIKRIKSWIATHLVRHHIGIEKFVSTLRDDRTNSDRDNKRQAKLINMDISLNAQALLNISRVRLCNMAHRETRNVWKEVVKEIGKIEPIIASKCVPNCVYRGRCPEMFGGCGYDKTAAFKKAVDDYWSID